MRPFVEKRDGRDGGKRRPVEGPRHRRHHRPKAGAMLTNLYFAFSNFEPVFGWLEAHPGLTLEVWGLERGRRMALLAYSDGPGDDYGWSNWLRSAAEDPSQLACLFEQLELVAEGETATQLQQAFANVFKTRLE